MPYKKILKKMGEVYAIKNQWPMRDAEPKETINRNERKLLNALEEEESGKKKKR